MMKGANKVLVNREEARRPKPIPMPRGSAQYIHML
jgi:hypothetical protein